MSLLGKINSIIVKGENNIIIQDVNNSTITININDTETIKEFIYLYKDRIEDIKDILVKLPHSIAHKFFIDDIQKALSEKSEYIFNPFKLEEDVYMLKSLCNDFNIVNSKFLTESTLLKVETIPESNLKNKLLLDIYQILSGIYVRHGQNRLKGGLYMDLLFKKANDLKDYSLAITGLRHSAINQYNMLLNTEKKIKQINISLDHYAELEKYLEFTKYSFNKEGYLKLKSNILIGNGAVLSMGRYSAESLKKLTEAKDIAFSLGDNSIILEALQHLGVYHLKNGNILKSEKYFRDAIDYSHNISSPLIAIFNKYLALFYLKADIPAKTIELLDLANHQANILGMTDQTRHINIVLKNVNNVEFKKNPLSLKYL